VTDVRDAHGPAEFRDRTIGRNDESCAKAPILRSARPSVVRIDAAGHVAEPQYRARVALCNRSLELP